VQGISWNCIAVSSAQLPSPARDTKRTARESGIDQTAQLGSDAITGSPDAEILPAAKSVFAKPTIMPVTIQKAEPNAERNPPAPASPRRRLELAGCGAYVSSVSANAYESGRPGGEREGTGSPLAARIVVAIASTLLALFLAEIVVRVAGIGPVFHVVLHEVFELSDNPVLGYELRAGAPDGDFSINDDGFRDRTFPLEKPAHSYRIAVIGDSLTYGFACPQDVTYPKQLERLLNGYAGPGDPRFEVLNFGVTGYNVTQIAERLRVLGLRYQPDLILYGYALNDLQEFSYEKETLEDLRDEAEERFHAKIRRSTARALSGSRLFLLARHAVSAPEPSPEPRLWGQIDPVIAAFARGDRRGEYFRTLHASEGPRLLLDRGLAELADLAQGADSTAVMALFPIFFEEEPEGYPLRDVHRLVAQRAIALGLHVVDLQPVFERARLRHGREVAHDPIHPSVLGHRIVAAALLWWIVDSGLLPDGVIDRARLENGPAIDRDTEEDLRIARESLR
jgi:lysophospholipase L1-like esterase